MGVPNACSACHEDKPISWVQVKYDHWYGTKRKPHYGTVLAAGRKKDPSAESDLVKLSQDPLRPLVARATALELLGAYPGPAARNALEKALVAPEPLLRATAARQLPVGDPAALARLVAPLLEDPVRAVRNEATARLAGEPAARLTGPQRNAFVAALDEYIEGQRYMSDLPSGPFNLGNIYAALGRTADAEQQYRRALSIDGELVPARVHLAQLLSSNGRLAEAEAFLREARHQRPDDAPIAFNLGLLLGQMDKPEEAEQALRAALVADARFAPAAYNLAVLLGERRLPEAISLARQAATLQPDMPRYAWTLGYFQARAGDLGGAAATLEALRVKVPENDDACRLLAEIYARQGRTVDAQALACGRQRRP
jgi:tetratricopeptide (TPR) repeat protein